MHRESKHSLAYLLTAPTDTTKQHQTPAPTLRRFAHRLGHKNRNDPITLNEGRIIQEDTTFQEYITHLKTIKGNDGYVSWRSFRATICAIRRFLKYTDTPITNTALSGLIAYKKTNPNSTDIEQALRAFSNEEPIKHSRRNGSFILGIFRANYAPLNLRISNHFEPAEENCSEGIFREIFSKLTDEQKAMIQWGLFLPERATAAYRVPLTDIDLSRQDYAIVTIRKHSDDYNNKSKVAHPALIPIWFAKPIIEQAKQQGRKSPFPNHQQEWKKITAFAKSEYKVRLVSNYTRKLFEAYASESTLSPAIAAFLMGDKTKLAKTGHLPEFYNLRLRFIEQTVKDYRQSGLERKLNFIDPQADEETEVQRLRRELAEATAKLNELTGS